MTDSQIEVRILQPGDEPALEAFLLPRLASSLFLLSNCRDSGLRDTGKPYTGTYAAAFRGGALVGVVGHFWTGILIPQAPDAPVVLDRLWRAAAAGSGREVRGAIGPADQVAQIKDAAGWRSSDLRTDHREKLYRLKLGALRVPDALAAGDVRCRRPIPDEVDVLVDWRAAYEAEALGATDGPELRASIRRSLTRILGEGRVWVLLRDGVPVSTTGFNAQIAEAVQVGGVYTPPELRRRGYARAAVAGSLLDAREAGASDAILFTDEDNAPAQRAYEALGFEHVGYLRLTLM